MTASWIRAGLVLGVLLALAPARPTLGQGQDVVPGGERRMTTPDLAPDHWVMDALRRAEGLGLLERPLPFRKAIAVDHAGEALEHAAEAARVRNDRVTALTSHWVERFRREFGGIAPAGAVQGTRLVGLRGRVAGVSAAGRAAPGYGEIAPTRTGAVPLDDRLVASVEGEGVAALGTHLGLMVQPEIGTETIGLRRLDVTAGRGNWTLAVGRQPLGLGKSVPSGLTVSGAVALDRVELRTARTGMLPGVLRRLGPAGAQLFLGRITDSRHDRQPYLWGGSLSIQPFDRFGVAVHRAAMFGGRGWQEPFTVKTLVDMLIGRVANLGFENQIVSVEGRFRLPSERWIPLTAFMEWGAEDAAGGWWDVPGRVVGLETPAVPGAEGLAVGIAHTAITAHCCGNSPWYRHGAFPGNWAVDDRPLGVELGGEGSEWLLYGTFEQPRQNYRSEARFFRREREGQNLFVPGRSTTTGGEIRGTWISGSWEFDTALWLETGSGHTEHRLELGANLFF